MKYTGFIKEYNNIKEAISFEEMLGTAPLYDDNTLLYICDYLDNGVLVLAWMGYFIDFQTKKIIAPDSYYTDGVWVWPSYLSYYLKNYANLKLDAFFIEDILTKQKNSKIHDISILEREVSNKLNELL